MSDWVTALAVGTPRNDFTGWVGTYFTVGGSSLTVTHLARWVISGNSGTHTVKLVNQATGVDVSGGSVSVNTSGATAGAFKWVALASPVTLTAGGTYILASDETASGDQFYDNNAILTTGSGGNALGSVYSTGTWTTVANAGHSYVGVNFRDNATRPNSYTNKAWWRGDDPRLGLADGNAFINWLDSSGLANTATSDLERPVFKTNLLDSKAGGRFSVAAGARNRMKTAAPVSTVTDNLVMFVVCKCTDTSAPRLPLYNGSSYGIAAATRSGTVKVGIDIAGVALYNGPTTPAGFCVIAARRKAGAWDLYLDGAPDSTTGTAAPITPTGYSVISWETAYFVGDILEAFIIEGSLTDADMDALGGTYLHSAERYPSLTAWSPIVPVIITRSGSGSLSSTGSLSSVVRKGGLRAASLSSTSSVSLTNSKGGQAAASVTSAGSMSKAAISGRLRAGQLSSAPSLISPAGVGGHSSGAGSLMLTVGLSLGTSHGSSGGGSASCTSALSALGKKGGVGFGVASTTGLVSLVGRGGRSGFGALLSAPSALSVGSKAVRRSGVLVSVGLLSGVGMRPDFTRKLMVLSAEESLLRLKRDGLLTLEDEHSWLRFRR